MPTAHVNNAYLSASRGAGHLLHVFFLRLKRVNPALLIAFVSALIMFLRALSGAGYIDPQAYDAPSSASGFNQSLGALDEASRPSIYVSFAEHWARFKESFLSCPPEPESEPEVYDDTGLLQPGDETPTDSGAEPQERTRTKSRTKTGILCLRERLGSAIDLRGASGPVVRKEDRAFGASLNGVPFGQRKAAPANARGSRGPDRRR